MIYSTSVESLKKKFDGVKLFIVANDLDDINRELDGKFKVTLWHSDLLMNCCGNSTMRKTEQMKVFVSPWLKIVMYDFSNFKEYGFSANNFVNI